MGSWFYLTLWRGTPADFTTTAEAAVGTASAAAAAVRTADPARAAVEAASRVAARIRRANLAVRKEITTTEVTWHVGRD